MPPNIGFSYYFLVFLMKFINISLQGCRQIFFSQKGCREPKKVEKHYLRVWETLKQYECSDFLESVVLYFLHFILFLS